MKNRIEFVLVFLLGSWANSQVPQFSMTMSAPLEVCKAIVESAKNKDYESIRQLSTGMNPNRPSSAKNKKFAEMEEKFFSHFESLTCGQALVTSDHAVVETATQSEKRLIPFVKIASAWKFDSETYRIFYDTRKRIKSVQ